MQIVILATGKCREKNMLALEKEYLSRLAAQWRASVRELPDNESKDVEAEAQLSALQSLPEPRMVVFLDERGEQVGSRAFADKISVWQGQGVKAVVFVIGGANGLSERVKSKAGWVMAFGRLTMPHQLVRVVLAEQIYRMQTILAGHPYHRD